MKKRLLSIALVLCMLLAMMPTALATEGDSASYEWYTSAGTDGVYTLSSAADLLGFANIVNGTAEGITQDSFANKTVKLGNDVNLAGIDWTPIGPNADAGNKFQGTFDGNGKTISYLKVNTASDVKYQATGFFGALNGTAKNFTIDGATITGMSKGNDDGDTDNGIAVVAGSIYNGDGSIEGVTVKNATVTGNRYVAAIAGYVNGNTVTNCVVENVELTASPDNMHENTYDNGDKVGGVVGYMGEGTVTNCSVNNTTITGYRDIGGIAGRTSCKVSECSIENVKLQVNSEPNYNKYTKSSEFNAKSYVGNGGSNVTGCTGNATVSYINFEAAIGDIRYYTLADAVAAAQSGDTVTMLADVTEGITVGENQSLTLDLNGKNITASTGDAIANKGTLTIQGSGTVSTTASGSAAIANVPGATCYVNGGSYKSNIWYTIKNLGTMEIDGAVNVTTENPANTSSLVANGWYGSKDKLAGAYYAPKESSVVSLTIKSGNFNGSSGENSCSVIKNDDYGVLTIEDGTFNSTANTGTENAATLMNWNKATIKGGTFTGSYPIANGNYNDAPSDVGEITISGGTFTGTTTIFGQNGGASANKGIVTVTGGSFNAPSIGGPLTYSIAISGGTFSQKPDGAETTNTTYCAAGYEWIDAADGKYTVTKTFYKTIALDKKTLDLTIGGTAKLTPTVEPTTVENNTITWTSSDETVATVEDGVVTAIKAGTATITATVPSGATVKCDVTVTAPAVADTETGAKVDLPTNATEEETKLATDVKDALKEKGGVDVDITEEVKKVAEEVTITAKEAKEALKEEVTVAETDTVKVVVQPYMDVAIKDVSVEGTTKTLTLDITPMARTIVTTAKENVKIVTEEDGKNAVVVAEKKLEITETVEVKVPVPESFADGEVYVKHVKSDGKTYVYTGKVEDGVLTFTNPHGFSEFIIGVEAPAAKIGTVGYASLQDAVDEVKDNETIDALASGSATVNRVVTFKVKAASGVTPEIKAGQDVTLTKTEENGVVTYTAKSKTPITKLTLTADKTSAKVGETVTLTVTTEPAAPSNSPIIFVSDEKLATVTKDLKVKLLAPGVVTITAMDGNVVDSIAGNVVDSIKITISCDLGDGCSSKSFKDIPEKDVWYHSAVDYVLAKGIMQGRPNKIFDPEAALTRAELAQILYNMAGEPEYLTTKTFPDVAKKDWFYDAVMWAASRGVITGYEDGTFKPNQPLTRQEMVVMIWRYYHEPAPNDADAALAKFPDSKEGVWNKDAFAWMIENEYVNGKNGKLAAGAETRRCEVAQILMKMGAEVETGGF